jgi:hypothetical protein
MCSRDSNGMIHALRPFSVGAGLPLLLLHGYPQTQVAWRSLAPLLAQHYTVVATESGTRCWTPSSHLSAKTCCDPAEIRDAMRTTEDDGVGSAGVWKRMLVTRPILLAVGAVQSG